MDHLERKKLYRWHTILNEQRTSWIAYVFWLQNFMNNVFSSYISICVLVCSCLWASVCMWRPEIDSEFLQSLSTLFMEVGSIKWTWELANVLEMIIWLSRVGITGRSLCPPNIYMDAGNQIWPSCFHGNYFKPLSPQGLF